MPRMNEWQREIHDGTRREVWSLVGPNRVVKILANFGNVASSLGGYITIGRSILGRTPFQIEHDLGLPPGFLRDGARIYRFRRLPFVSEYEYDLTADYPGGLAFSRASSDPNYPPGSREVHQWRIKAGIHVPVYDDFLELKPGQRFPYDWLLS